MSSLPTGKGVLPAPGTGVDSHRLADDQAILNQFPDLVGIGNLIGFIWIQPYFFLATAQHAGGEPLLKSEHAAEKPDYSHIRWSTCCGNFWRLVAATRSSVCLHP
uniref:Uncharacterized protein n=1 Tax=Xenopus tropicalis TaxID=8364 RepID=A0A6I8PWM3_XENTR